MKRLMCAIIAGICLLLVLPSNGLSQQETAHPKSAAELASQAIKDKAAGKQARESAETSSGSISAANDADKLEYTIKKTIGYHVSDYYKVSIIRLDVNPDLSSFDEEAKIVNAYLEFGANNGESLTKKLMEGYSNEIAGMVAKNYSDKHITTINLFWEAPYFIDVGNAAKYQYIINNGWLILKSKIGPLYGVN